MLHEANNVQCADVISSVFKRFTFSQTLKRQQFCYDFRREKQFVIVVTKLLHKYGNSDAGFCQ